MLWFDKKSISKKYFCHYLPHFYSYPAFLVQNPTTTPKPNASSNLTNNETEIYQVANDLFVPEVTEEFLGDIDSVCVWLR